MNRSFNEKKIKAVRFLHMKLYYINNEIKITSCPFIRSRLEKELISEIDSVLDLMEGLYMDLELNGMEEIIRQTNEFTITELATFDGSEGKPAYVAVNRIVYDVSKAETWGGGSHFGLIAGKDLTEQFNSCHGKIAILSKLTMVGVLK
jgi:predicted heme/steroid binding protein